MSDWNSQHFVEHLRIEKARELEHGNFVLHVSTYPDQSTHQSQRIWVPCKILDALIFSKLFSITF